MLVLVLLALLAVTPADIVRLADGRLVHGTIVDFDEGTGFTIVRADTGGRVALRWEHLSAAETRRIKESRGFTGEDPQPFLVDVVHLVMKNGTTETGVLVDDGRRDVYTLTRRNSTDSFPKQYVRSVESGRVEGLSVYSAEDLYQLLLTQLGTPTTAAQHFETAVAAEGANLYVQARDHYTAAAGLDPSLKPELIALRIDRAAIKIEDSVETARLDEIRNRLYKKQFDVALRMVDEFRQDFPASRQLGDLVTLEGDIGRRRRNHYQGKVVSDYFSFLGKSLGEVSRADDMTLGAALELVEESIHLEIVERLGNSYKMDAEGIESLWEARKGGSVRTSSYGTGTFILGEEKALDWVGEKDEEEAEEEEVSEEDEDLQDRIDKVLKKRAAEARQRAKSRRSSRSLEEGISPDEWWEQATSDDRMRWLMAYYSEFSGHISVLRAKPRNCRTCEASGRIEVMNEKGEVEAALCPTCKGLKYERIVNFR
ncbi:MAG: hypothetical protein ACYTCU_04905 [Planctomycetota bacterium]|jgi:hypothetical protein